MSDNGGAGDPDLDRVTTERRDVMSAPSSWEVFGVGGCSTTARGGGTAGARGADGRGGGSIESTAIEARGAPDVILSCTSSLVGFSHTESCINMSADECCKGRETTPSFAIDGAEEGIRAEEGKGAEGRDGTEGRNGAGGGVWAIGGVGAGGRARAEGSDGAGASSSIDVSACSGFLFFKHL